MNEYDLQKTARLLYTDKAAGIMAGDEVGTIM